MRLLAFFVVWVMMLGLCSCGKTTVEGTEGDGRDTTRPIVVIVAPISTAPVNAGDKIRIEATATDNVKLTELHIHVTNAISGAILRDIHSYPGQPTGVVKDSFPAQGGLIYQIKIISFDPSQNLGSAQIQVPVN